MEGATMRRSAAAAATLAAMLALAAAGCGDNGDDNGNAAAGGGGQAADGAGGELTGREAEVNEALVGIQDDFVAVDGASYCDRLAPAGIRQVEDFGRAYGYDSGDCVKVVNTIAKNTRDSGIKQRPTKLISVKFDGDRAIATIRNGRRPREEMIFVNQAGEWKIPDPGFETGFDGATNTEPLSTNPAERFRQILRERNAVKRRNQDR